MRQSLNRPHRWISIALFLLGVLTVGIWWRIRLLGDVRDHLGVFYGWFAAAFLLYLAAWWVVRRIEAARTPSTPRSSWLVVLILFWALVARLLLLGTTPFLSSDLYRYHWDGRVQRAGIDPYAYAPDDPTLYSLRDEHFAQINFPHLRTIYPPVAELVFRLGASIGPALTGQKIVFLLAEGVTCVALLILLLTRGMSPLWVVAYAWHPLAILEFAGSGHNDALGIAMLWLGVAAWERRWWLGSSLAWAAAFLSKFLSVILVPWWWFRQRARVWLWLFLLITTLPLAVHPTAASALFDSLSAMAGRFESNASLYAVLAWLMGSASLARWLALGAWAGFLVWWARRESDVVRYLVGGLTVAALFSPVLHPWYLTWLVPCLCFWRVPAVVALTGTVVLAYTVWPGYLADGVWRMPLWARELEYAPVFLLGGWEVWRCVRRSSFQLVTKPQLCVKS